MAAWSCLAFVAVGIGAAVAVNRAILSHTWTDASRCVDAAALAACQSLLTDDLLRDSSNNVTLDWQIDRARDKAIQLSRLHESNQRLPIIRRNDINVYQRVWTSERGEYVLLTDSEYPNTVRVGLSTRNSAARDGRSRSVGFGGIRGSHVSCVSTACIHDRICGFQSGPGISIPLVPLAIPGSQDGDVAGTWSAVDTGDGNDDYYWDEELGQLLNTADGLSELTLVIRPGISSTVPGQFMPVKICPTQHTRAVTERIRRGFNHAELEQAGLSDIRFPRTDAAYDLDESEFDDLERVLRSLIGEKRVYPIVEHIKDMTEVELSKIVAARILKVDRTGSRELSIVLQPTVMSVPAAIFCRDDSVRANRYVRHIALLR